MTKLELPRQGSLKPNRQQRVEVYLVANNRLILELSGMISTNQTSQFPIVSQKRNQYMMVLYNYDLNAILAKGCKTRTGTKLTAIYNILYT